MKVIVRARAADDLIDIFHFIAAENPQAAADVVRRIRQRIHRLAAPGLAHMGRPGRVVGTRELVEAPYLIVYEVQEDRDELVVLGIFHGAQNRR